MAPSTLSIAEYEELGRHYYKEHQYHKAVEVLSEAIFIASPSPTVKLLDCRAAAYVKLDKLKLALDDARTATRIDKKNVTGYVRLGDILNKMQRYEAAQKVYELGKRNVPVFDPKYKVLQGMHDKTTRLLSPAKAKDPFKELPVELMEMVLSYLNFKAFVNCLRVCKAWRDYLKKRPSLWTVLDLSFAKRTVSREFVRDVVLRSNSGVTRAIIHRFPHEDMLRNLASVCKGLTELVFLPGNVLGESLKEMAFCAQNLKKLVYHGDVSLDLVSQVMRWRPTLAHVEFTSITAGRVFSRFDATGPQRDPTAWVTPMPYLHTLILVAGPKTNYSMRLLGVTALLRQTPALKAFNLTRFRSQGADAHAALDLSALPLTHLTLQDCDISVFPFLPKTIESLYLEHCKAASLGGSNAHRHVGHWAWANPSYANAMRSKVPLLSEITLKGYAEVHPDFLRTLLQREDIEEGVDDNQSWREVTNGALNVMARLTTFGVPSCALPAGHNVRSFLLLNTGPCDRLATAGLKNIDLSGLLVTDDDIQDIVPVMTGLETVKLQATRVTGAGIKMLVDNLPNLQFVDADNCLHISSPDVLAYAKSKGVTVSWKIPDRKQEKRIRYG